MSIFASVMEQFFEILKSVTVNSRDDGKVFTCHTRIDAIKKLLNSSSYKLIHEGNLSLIYALHRPQPGERVVLVSSHIDSLHSNSFCHEEGDCYKGTFDNSYTNASVLWNMLNSKFADNVVIAFTGDEEQDSQGAIETVCALGLMQCPIAFALVLDVTEEGWMQHSAFTVENDLGLDIFTAHHLVELLKPYDGKYSYVHDAEPDESWDYDEYSIPCFTLCAPILGDMHSDEGVLLRKDSFPMYQQVLSVVANNII